MKTEVMLDLETMSTRADAAIVSIGLVIMDMDALEIRETMHTNVQLGSSQAAGLHIDAATVEWWMLQDDEAKASLRTPQAIPLASALKFLVEDVYAEDSYPTWGNGAGFDNVILRSAYRAVKMQCPIIYGHDRCYRTMKAMFPEIRPQSFLGTKHNAVVDATNQATHLLAIMRHIRGQDERVHQNGAELPSD